MPQGSEQRRLKCHNASARVLGSVLGTRRRAEQPDEEGGANLHVEVYDDSDFYHALLRELLEDGQPALCDGLCKPRL